MFAIYPADVRDADALISHGDLDAFRAVMDVNYYGMVATFELFIASMMATRRGTLVGISNVAGIRGLLESGAYSSASKSAATKFGVIVALRVEMRPKSIAVVTIAPVTRARK